MNSQQPDGPIGNSSPAGAAGLTSVAWEPATVGAAVVEHSGEALAVVDSRGIIQYVNPAFEQLTGYSHGELVRQHCQALALQDVDAVQSAERWERLRAGQSWTGRVTKRRRDGICWEAVETLVPLPASDATPAFGLALWRDVTREVALEDQLGQTQKLEAIGELCGGVAHDLNNLLTAVFGYTTLGKTAVPADHKAYRSFESVEEAARLATGITRGLLTLAGKGVADKKPICAGAALRAAVSLLRRMLPATITLRAEIPDDPPLWICADAGELQQVLMNLFLDSRAAMPAGGTIDLSLTVRQGAPRADAHGDRRWARLTVRYAGLPVSAAEPAPERRWGISTKTPGRGTGLGLAVVHAIVQNHDGQMAIEALGESGGQVTIELPILGHVPHENGTAAGSVSRGMGELVLLAEDDEHVRAILTSALEAANYGVVTAADGAALLAQHAAHGDHIRLLLLDVDLPKRDGLDCLRALRRDGVRTPAIIITAAAQPGLDDGLDDSTLVLYKPFQLSELTRLMHNHLRAPGVVESAR